MKKAKKVIEYKGIQFRSKEELEFFHWLLEARDTGFVLEFEYEPKTFILAEPKYADKKFLLHKQIYTPDFFVIFSEKFNLVFGSPLYLINNRTYIDVKGVYAHGNSMNSSAYTFPVIQKWIYDKMNIYINKVVVRDMSVKNNIDGGRKITKVGFFNKTWVPREVAFMKNRLQETRVKSFEHCRLISEVKNDSLF